MPAISGIARSADCAGVDFIVVPERGSASVTSDAVKASAGALFYVLEYVVSATR